MISKSGRRFSQKIMLKQMVRAGRLYFDSSSRPGVALMTGHAAPASARSAKVETGFASERALSFKFSALSGRLTGIHSA
jgi:hypothetical protein